MISVVLLLVFNVKIIVSLTTEKIYLTSIERSVDIPLRELDKRLVKMLTEPPPSIDKNVQANAQMNVLLFRYITDYFNYLNGIGDLLLNEDNNGYRLLEEIGVEGPEFLKLEMLKESWQSIGKLYGFHEGEVEEMTTTFGATKFMWENMKKQLEAHLENKKKA